MSLQVRDARAEELAWANERWAEIGFVTSPPGRDLLVVAEVDGARVGLGRLVRLPSGEVELGGILVLPAFRGRGVAEAIVGRLVRAITPGTRAFCVPFAHLEAFYARFGFTRADEATCAAAPAEICDKLRFCAATYPTPAVLMVRRAGW